MSMSIHQKHKHVYHKVHGCWRNATLSLLCYGRFGVPLKYQHSKYAKWARRGGGGCVDHMCQRCSCLINDITVTQIRYAHVCLQYTLYRRTYMYHMSRNVWSTSVSHISLLFDIYSLKKSLQLFLCKYHEMTVFS